MPSSITTPYGTFPLTRGNTKFITVYKSPEGNRYFKYKTKLVKPDDLVFTEHKKVGGAIHSPQTFAGCNKLGTFDLEGKLVTERGTDRYDGDDRAVDTEALAKGLEDLKGKKPSELVGLPTDYGNQPSLVRFTQAQYDTAIASLKDAATQPEPNGDNCHCCGDSGHQAFECGHNPLVAVALCVAIAKDARELHEQLHAQDGGGLKALNETNRLQADSDKLHELLHYLGGFDSYMGCTRGPAKVIAPK